MKTEEIHEPVEVIAVFRHGRFNPLKFRWKSRVYKVARVTGSWLTEEGETRFHHFSVMSEGPDIFELTYNEHEQKWMIETIAMVG